MKIFDNPYAGRMIAVAMCLAVVTILLGFAIRIEKRHERAASDTLIYQKGLKDGYEEGMGVLEIYKVSAIESGVAKYLVVDELKGTTSFVWVTPDGSNVVTNLR